MKPIEPGCLAIVIYSEKPEDIGKPCRVLQRVGGGQVFQKCTGGEAKNCLGAIAWHVQFHEKSGGLFLTQDLLRIDGGELIDQEQEEEVGCD